MNDTAYPYSVVYPRSVNWYGNKDGESDWFILSRWCNKTFGNDNWEFHHVNTNLYRFVFKCEEHKSWFIMRWS